jgi:hypothetical protein
MAQHNTTTTLDGLFKIVHASAPVKLLPDFAILSKRVKFQESEKLGEEYRVPVKLQYEQGFTYGAAGDGAFTLNDAVAGKVAKAKVTSAQIVLRSSLDYESAFKAASAGKQAFQEASQAVVENMSESFAKRQEIAFLYGGKGLGVISGTPSTSGSNKVITFTEGSWAAGMWVGMKDCNLDVYNGSSKINTNAAVVIVSVDIANRQITVSGNATDLGNLADGHTIYFKGAYGKECNGIDNILTNTGTLYNIDASSYELWKSSSYAVSGLISMNKVLLGASQATALGLKEDAIVLLSPKRWTQLNNELAANRRTDSSYSAMKIEQGTEGITYYGVNGKMEVIAHPMVKDGDGFILPEKRLKRIGATDMTFSRPGNKDSFFRELSDAAGYELRAYADQQMFCEAPGLAVKLTGLADS